MESDEETLRALNIEIANAEDLGKRKWLAKILAPKMAFRRANADRTFDSRNTFLKKVAPLEEGKSPKTTKILEPIEIYGDRAIVQCVVTVGQDQYHNIRLFVRVDGSWKLLGWANERVSN